jgi:hypothetical protein
VEGAISETSKVWQLETFELEVQEEQLYCTSELFFKTVLPLYLAGEHEEERSRHSQP